LPQFAAKAKTPGRSLGRSCRAVRC
jgi:hypothetical protein